MSSQKSPKRGKNASNSAQVDTKKTKPVSIAVVTGCARKAGIGHACCEALLSSGNYFVVGIDAAALEATPGDGSSAPGGTTTATATHWDDVWTTKKFYFRRSSVSDYESVSLVLQSALAFFEKERWWAWDGQDEGEHGELNITVVINCAGKSDPYMPSAASSPSGLPATTTTPNIAPVRERIKAFDEYLDGHLRGAFVVTECSRAFFPKTSSGSSSAGDVAVVNIGSSRAHQSEPGTEGYAAAKGGLLALTHAMAASYGEELAAGLATSPKAPPAVVRVNCISPGWVDTSGIDGVVRPDDHNYIEQRWGASVFPAVSQEQDVACPDGTYVLRCTQNWIAKWVVGRGVCPFARPLVDRSKLRVALFEGGSVAELKTRLWAEIELLRGSGCRNEDPRDTLPESTILACSSHQGFLAEYFDFYRVGSKLATDLAAAQLEEGPSSEVADVANIVHTVLFHPRAVRNEYSAARHISYPGDEAPGTAGDELEMKLPDLVSSDQEDLAPGPVSVGRRSRRSIPFAAATRRQQSRERLAGSMGRRTVDSAFDEKEKKENHDQYRSISFAGEGEEDAWGPNYVLRAPFPTFHLLRQRDIDAVKRSVGKSFVGSVAGRNFAALAKDPDVEEFWRRKIYGRDGADGGGGGNLRASSCSLSRGA
eukprot:g4454.t1